MISITHYEVYTDRGEGWKLEDRFSGEQRQEAFGLAKEREREKIKVKIIKEIFDVQDNTYQEAVEYVSGLSGNKPTHKKNGDFKPSRDGEDLDIDDPHAEKSLSASNVSKAILKLISIIILCLVFANLLVTFIAPIIENFVDEKSIKPILFSTFFVLFLSLAVPLVLKKVPWYVFTEKTKVIRHRELNEKKFYDKAEAIIAAYNLNDDFDSSVTPVFPEAPLEYKRYIVSFLSDIINNIDSNVSLKDSFSRLGVKLIVYGGCLELSRYSGLKVTHANSLLHEAFCVLDGDITNLEAFYDAKRTYRDNKTAVFLTGVGAYLMTQVIEERPMASHIIKTAFGKWERQNNSTPETEDNTKTREVNIMVKSLLSIKSELHFLEDNVPNQDATAEKISGEIRNIIYNLLTKFRGENVIEANGITSIEFIRLNEAVKFAVEYLKDISSYQDKVEGDTFELHNRCAIIKYNSTEEPNLSATCEDILDQVYDDEVVVSKEIESELRTSYKFDFLGEKKLPRSGRSIELYKLLE